MFPDRIRRNGQRPVRGVMLGWTDDGQVVVKFEDRRTTQILDADCIIGANNHPVGPMPEPGADWRPRALALLEQGAEWRLIARAVGQTHHAVRAELDPGFRAAKAAIQRVSQAKCRRAKRREAAAAKAAARAAEEAVWIPQARQLRAEGLGWQPIAERIGVGVHRIRARIDPDYLESESDRAARRARERAAEAEWIARAHDLRARGMAWDAVARAVGVSRNTVRMRCDLEFAARTRRLARERNRAAWRDSPTVGLLEFDEARHMTAAEIAARRPAERTDTTAIICGDPAPGRSAADRPAGDGPDMATLLAPERISAVGRPGDRLFERRI